MPFSSMNPTYRRILESAIAVVLLIVGLYQVPIAIFGADFGYIPGDLGDARFNNYILEHGYQWMTGNRPNGFWNAEFMYPLQNVIAYSDNLLGAMPFYAIFRKFGCDREYSFQLWIMAVMTLNFICAYYALNRWSRNRLLAASGAYIYAFSIILLGNIYNVQTLPRFAVPLVIYWSWKYFREGGFKYLVLLALGIIYQFYCGMYLGFLLVYSMIFLVLAYLIVYRDWSIFTRFTSRNNLIQLGGVVVVSVLLMLPLIGPYYTISKGMPERFYADIVETVPRIQSYFFSAGQAKMWTILSQHGTSIGNLWYCHFLWVGALPWIAILLLPVVFIKLDKSDASKKLLQFLALTLFLSIIFCLQIGNFSLYQLMFKLPGFSSMRSMNRIINTEILFFVLILVMVAKVFLSDPRLKFIAFLLPVLVICDNLIKADEVVHYNIADSKKEILAVKEQIQDCWKPQYKAVAYMPASLKDNPIQTHLHTMLACQELNIPCVNAYTGHQPGEYNEFGGQGTKEGLQKWCDFTHFPMDKILSPDPTSKYKLKSFQLVGPNGKFLCIDPGLAYAAGANRDGAAAWETLKMSWTTDSTLNNIDSKVVIVAHNRKFMSGYFDQPWQADGVKHSQVNDFSIHRINATHIAIKANNGKYLSINEGTLLFFAKSDSIGPAETFEMKTSADHW